MIETTTTCAEHLTWCKARAMEYIRMGDANQAWASFASDMRKHPETQDHAALELGMILLMTGNLSTLPKMREFINGCN